MKIDFILPIYNEELILEENCQKLLQYLKGRNYNFPWRLILLINGSSDRSEEIAQKIAQENKPVEFFFIKEKGRGQALKKYFDHSQAEAFFYMDADLAVSLDNINDFIETYLKEDLDLIIGSRLKKESQTERSHLRELSSRFYVLLSKIILRHSFSDLQCGFKLIKKNSWKKISPLIQDENWFFDTELLIFSQKLSLKTKEIAVNWSENRYKKRKTKVKIIKDTCLFIKNLLKLKKRLKGELKYFFQKI